jgi:C_GCAxxG_C_C family probable redox protein
MTKSDIAVNKFKDGFNCSQAVVYSFADEINIDRDAALKMANGFGGGMGRKQEVCGAISGAIMVLSSLFGRGENDGKEKHENTYRKVRELVDAFKKECGTIHCRELLLGCDLLSEAGQQRFKDDHLVAKCHECIRVSCIILEKML